MIITQIVSQHAEEAAFLWLLRSNAIHQPHYALKDLAKLDDRVAAHLDGLRVAEEPDWELCTTARANGEEREKQRGRESIFLEGAVEEPAAGVWPFGVCSQCIRSGGYRWYGWSFS